MGKKRSKGDTISTVDFILAMERLRCDSEGLTQFVLRGPVEFRHHLQEVIVGDEAEYRTRKKWKNIREGLRNGKGRWVYPSADEWASREAVRIRVRERRRMVER